MKDQPTVSVICLCYNHARFVEESIRSALEQTYQKTEIIIVDDASSDESVAVIERLRSENPSIRPLYLEQNVGNCKAFNRGLSLASGKFIIDLAADDILLPHRIATGVSMLQQAGPKYGVHFSDAEWISENGEPLFLHSSRFPHHTIPRGDIYKELVQRYFICSPTMMYTRAVVDHLGGYDENLLYEDFDFWIRSSREFYYTYSPEVLVKKRVVKKSLYHKQFSLFSPYQYTTFRVCEKILQLNRTTEEKQALSRRIRYELRTNLRLLNFLLVWKYFSLLKENLRARYPQ